MLRKTFACLLVCLSLLVNGAVAEETFHMMDFYNANALDNILVNPGDSMTLHGNEFDADGNVLSEYTHHLTLDEDGQLCYIYKDTHFTQQYRAGLAVGYDYEADEPFIDAYLGDAAADYEAWLRANLPLSLFGDYENDDQYVTEIRRENGVLTVFATYSEVGENSDAAGIASEQSMEEDTLRILADNAAYMNADGSVQSSKKATYTYGEPMAMDERALALLTPAETRTLNVVIDPGTPEEHTQVLTLPRSMAAGMMQAEGYALYADAAATTPLTSLEKDADGSYPAECTIYMAKLPADAAN